VCEELRRDLNMKGVFVMNTSLHDILFMSLDKELRKHYQEIAVKQGLCQVTWPFRLLFTIQHSAVMPVTRQ